MRALWQGIRAWWLRRFRGFVAPPAQHGGRGTSWQEHKRHEIGFTCSGTTASGERCGSVLAFMSTDLVVREQDHTEACDLQYAAIPGMKCNCPIIDARYVKICPTCRLGHWKDASPRMVDKTQSRSHA
jgi:hypothetical protein